MKTIEEIILDYTSGKAGLPETNEALKAAEEEMRGTTVGYYPDQANGYGLMDHGVSCMEKVHVVNGKTVDVNMGAETACVYIAGKKYELKGDTLAEPEG